MQTWPGGQISHIDAPVNKKQSTLHRAVCEGKARTCREKPKPMCVSERTFGISTLPLANSFRQPSIVMYVKLIRMFSDQGISQAHFSHHTLYQMPSLCTTCRRHSLVS